MIRLPAFLRRHAALGLIGLGLAGFLGFSAALGFGPRELSQELRHRRFRREADALLLRLPGETGFQDFLPEGPASAWVLMGGGLHRLEGGALSLRIPEGLGRMFPGPDRIWFAASYHRVLSLEGQGRLHHELGLPGTLREFRQSGGLLAVAFEAEDADSQGRIRFFRQGPGYWQPTGIEIPIGLDRWCGFDLSPDGSEVAANLPEGRGVGRWTVAEGRLIAQWPAERLSRLIAFCGDGSLLFESGPRVLLRDLRPLPDNRLLRATAAGTEAVVQGFAPILARAIWPDRSRLAFSDGEGMLRLLELRTGRLETQFAPASRGALLHLRAQDNALWCASSAEELRLERFDLR